MTTNVLPAITLVLGGARSGKSAYAEGLCGGAGVYLATAEARDGEMAERIRHHRQRRGDGWITVEEPLNLSGALKDHARPGRPVLVDCLTLWLSNLIGAGLDGDRTADQAVDGLVETLGTLQGPVVLVSNEVGQGIIPDNALARAYMDTAGRMNQKIAAAADRVVLVTAGLPLNLKSHES